MLRAASSSSSVVTTATATSATMLTAIGHDTCVALR
jgi:hypothetical protein